MDLVVNAPLVVLIFTMGFMVGILLGCSLRVWDERRIKEERLWMRVLYNHKLNEMKGMEAMKKGLLVVLIMVGLCFLSVPAFPAEFSETNTQEIGDEVFQACVAKGVIKGENPPRIIMKVRATCSEAYTSMFDELKKYVPGSNPTQPPAPAPKKAEEKSSKK